MAKAKKTNEFDDIFAQAESATEDLNSKVDAKKGRDERLLDCNKSKTVIFRMFPDFMGEKPILDLPYNFNSFTSPFDGKNVPLGVSAALWGKDDFVKKFQIELYEQNQKDLAKLLYPSRRCRVNVFVVSDSSDDEAAQTFRVFDYSAKVIDPARARSGSPFVKFINKLLTDDDSEITKKKLFSLNKDGVTIKMTIIKTEGVSWPEFEFEVYHGAKNKIFDKFTDEQALEICKTKGTNLIDMLEEPRSDEELEKILRTRLLGVTTGGSTGNQPDVDFSEAENDDSAPFETDDDDTPAPKAESDDVPENDISEESETDFDKIMEQFNDKD